MQQLSEGVQWNRVSVKLPWSPPGSFFLELLLKSGLRAQVLLGKLCNLNKEIDSHLLIREEKKYPREHIRVKEHTQKFHLKPFHNQTIISWGLTGITNELSCLIGNKRELDSTYPKFDSLFSLKRK